MMKRFLCLLCVMLMAAPYAFAEPEIIIPEAYEQKGTLSVYAAIPRDFTKVVKPEMFNDSGIAETITGRHDTYSVTFKDEAQLQCHREALYYNEYDGKPMSWRKPAKPIPKCCPSPPSPMQPAVWLAG